jgi:hypothetical protein
MWKGRHLTLSPSLHNAEHRGDLRERQECAEVQIPQLSSPYGWINAWKIVRNNWKLPRRSRQMRILSSIHCRHPSLGLRKMRDGLSSSDNVRGDRKRGVERTKLLYSTNCAFLCRGILLKSRATRDVSNRKASPSTELV